MHSYQGLGTVLMIVGLVGIATMAIVPILNTARFEWRTIFKKLFDPPFDPINLLVKLVCSVVVISLFLSLAIFHLIVREYLASIVSFLCGSIFFAYALDQWQRRPWKNVS